MAIVWVDAPCVWVDAEIFADYHEKANHGRIMADGMQSYGSCNWDELRLAAESRGGMANITKTERERMVPRARCVHFENEDNDSDSPGGM